MGSLSRPFTSLCILLLPLTADAYMAAGGEGPVTETFGRAEIESVAKAGGQESYKKVWPEIQKMLDEQKANEEFLARQEREKEKKAQAQPQPPRRLGEAAPPLAWEQGAQRYRMPEEKPAAKRDGAPVSAMKALQRSAAASGAAAPDVPDVPEPVQYAAKAGGERDEDAELKKKIDEYVEKVVVTPRIKPMMRDYLLIVAKHQGGNEAVRDAVNNLRSGLMNGGEGLPNKIEEKPMDDENTYGTYTTGVREVALRPGMGKRLFYNVTSHEMFGHGTDDRQDAADKNSKLSQHIWRKRKDSKGFEDMMQEAGGGSGKSGKDGGCGCPGSAAPAPPEDGSSDDPSAAEAPEQGRSEAAEDDGMPDQAARDEAFSGWDSFGSSGGAKQTSSRGEGSEPQDGEQLDGAWAEVYAWRIMGCLTGVEPMIKRVQKCD